MASVQATKNAESNSIAKAVESAFNLYQEGCMKNDSTKFVIFKIDYLTSHNAANRAGYVSPVEDLNAEQISEIYNGFLHRFG